MLGRFITWGETLSEENEPDARVEGWMGEKETVL